MLIHRDTLRAALLATTKEDSRYFLHAVQVRPDGTVVATNGHMLVTVRDSHTIPDEDFPRMANTGVFVTSPTEPVCLPVPLAEKLIAATQKKGTTPVLACVQIGQDAAGGIFATATDLETSLSSPLPTGDNAPRFPTTVDRSMVSEDRPHLSVKFSACYLAALVKAAGILYGKHPYDGVVEFQIPTEPKYQATRTVSTAEDGTPITEPTGEILAQIRVVITGPERTLDGVLMPVRP